MNENEFQSPIGTQKTIISSSCHRPLFQVSIPYRYTKNKEVCSMGCFMRGFQSPIGTQKTHLWLITYDDCTEVSIPYRYTKNGAKLFCRSTEAIVSIPYRYTKNERGLKFCFEVFILFQSPIGTQKTQIAWEKEVNENGVSIPYRYTKNALPKSTTMGGAIVSIPYRYTKNRAFVLMHFSLFRVSIPYRYTKNLLQTHSCR